MKAGFRAVNKVALATGLAAIMVALAVMVSALRSDSRRLPTSDRSLEDALDVASLSLPSDTEVLRYGAWVWLSESWQFELSMPCSGIDQLAERNGWQRFEEIDDRRHQFPLLLLGEPLMKGMQTDVPGARATETRNSNGDTAAFAAPRGDVGQCRVIVIGVTV